MTNCNPDARHLYRHFPLHRTLPLVVALGIDRLLGEPPSSVHPVVWIGRLVAALERRAPTGDRARLLYGGMGVGAVVSSSALSAILAQRALCRLPFPLRLLAASSLLKTTFAVHNLTEAADDVRAALLDDDLDGARAALRSLVSRDTVALSPSLLAAAATESVAENTADSVVAPLLYYMVGGLPGAFAYRAINTCDSMWGYHGRYEHLGKAAARLDNLANLLPSRLTGLLIVAAGALVGRPAADGWHVMLRDHALTASPNAGWPMSAMAGLLGVELEKIGHYRLGSPGAAPTPESIQAASRVFQLVASLTVLGCILVEAAHDARR